MFGCVGGGGFSSKCKSRIKLIRSRLVVIKKRKTATIEYLKKAMAGLLKNGLDINAYGRAEGLINELDHLSCYELIEQFCECILEKLSSMRKQRDCPPESREAVASLMFAAARFADLPELRDLRCIFTNRYGNFMESDINQQFVRKLESRPPSMDQKLQLMRNVSRDYSINWDSKGFSERISNPITSASDRVDKCESVLKGKYGAVAKTEKDDAVIKVDISSKERRHTPPRHEVKTDSSKERRHNPPRHEVKTDGSKGRQHTPPRHELKMDSNQVILPIANRGDHCPPFDCNKLGHRGSAENLKPQSTNNVIPPYIKTEGTKYGTGMEICPVGFDHCKPTDLSPDSRGIAYNGEKKNQVGLNQAVHEKSLVPVVAWSNGSGDENACNLDDSAVEAHLKLKSVRRKKQLKLLAHENYATTEDDVPVSRNSNGRRSQGNRRGIRRTYDDGHDEEDMIMDELLIHYSNKSTNKGSRPPKALRAPVHDSDASKSPLHQNNIGARLNSESSFPPKGAKAPARSSDASKSPLHRNKQEDRMNSESSLPPARVASLPSQRTTPTEATKVPVRAASLEPNLLSPHVHPKLPDYDDLAARFAVLRGELRK
ncbi:IST1-like protein [Cinnamomum micranthum f. kanehirae]|uniref:IST1-like protein n=1 Tax=Cinnamomum micranthum f. kanehirae TaxID=337451 RepID=A0A443NAZ4_9MAGN|nr:IST1-like protein [Cinnamomum micranthum f. kanehirae]